MRIVTWNVNSLKARLPRVELWIDKHQPDVLCLQETKLTDDAFPSLIFRALGYEAVHHGEGRWNGVAIVSKVGISDVVAGFGDGGPPDSDARILWATCGGVRVASVYVPNGRALDNDHYQYKLAWLARLRADLAANCSPGDDVVVAGDFNIAPDDRDVWDPTAFVEATHVSEPERAALREVEGWGLVDVFRRHHDEGGLFSWWDYRGGAFHKKQGMRIDLVLATEALAARSTDAFVDRDERKGKDPVNPSDHAPVVTEFVDAG